MKLTRFRVHDFRSVKDSGWVEVDRVTALIGVNESGKTNLLLPLWKLKPVLEGEIQPTSDYPKTLFGQIRESPEIYRFIEAEFAPDETGAQIAQAADITSDEAEIVRVSRFFDGHYTVEFPNYQERSTVDRNCLVAAMSRCASAIDCASAR